MKILEYFYVLLLSVLFASCEFDEVDLGYPHCVTFSKGGGEKNVMGTSCFTYANIQDYKSGDDGDFFPSQDDIVSAVYKWIKIEYTRNGTAIKIIAEPNTTGKTRKLHIELYSGPEYQVIQIKQE